MSNFNYYSIFMFCNALLFFVLALRELFKEDSGYRGNKIQGGALIGAGIAVSIFVIILSVSGHTNDSGELVVSYWEELAHTNKLTEIDHEEDDYVEDTADEECDCKTCRLFNVSYEVDEFGYVNRK